MKDQIHDPINNDGWMDRANCLGIDPDLFFPVRGESSDPAKAICAACVVRDECLAYAMDRPIHHGVWGGKSERDRRKMRAAARRRAAA